MRFRHKASFRHRRMNLLTRALEYRLPNGKAKSHQVNKNRNSDDDEEEEKGDDDDASDNDDSDNGDNADNEDNVDDDDQYVLHLPTAVRVSLN